MYMERNKKFIEMMNGGFGEFTQYELWTILTNQHELNINTIITQKLDNGKFVTNGGRVLGVTAKGATLKEARANAYAATEWIDFDNKYMRKDIGKAIDEA